MIQATTSNLRWNYFLALEHDLDIAARYVEFCEQNYEVSVEFAHLLFAAASEVDVIAKLFCQRLSPDASCRNIDDYRSVLTTKFPNLPETQVLVARYGLTLTPWDSWASSTNPLWWRSYNNVEHERDTFFHEATLKHALNALGALLILTVNHYRHAFVSPGEKPLCLKDTTSKLLPHSILLRLDDDSYHKVLIA